jgi:Lon protease-like protein
MVLIPGGELPLFPLDAVLFPGMTLPLHIFEPRYRQMLDDCLHGEQVFGVVLIKEGQEVGGAVEPYHVGTTARLLGVERKAVDRFHVVTVGEARFRVRRVRRDRPYLIGEVEPFPLAAVEATEVGALVEQGRRLLRLYLALLSRASGAEIRLQRLPEEPERVAYVIAMILQVTLPVKQRLLSMPDLPSLLREEVALLRSEGKALEVMVQDLASRGGKPPVATDELFSRN